MSSDTPIRDHLDALYGVAYCLEAEGNPVAAESLRNAAAVIVELTKQLMYAQACIDREIVELESENLEGICLH